MGFQTVGLWVSALEVKKADVCLYSSRYQDYHNKRTLHKIHIPNMVCSTLLENGTFYTSLT